MSGGCNVLISSWRHTGVKYMKPGLAFLSTTAATRGSLLGTKPRVPPKRKDIRFCEGEGCTAGYQASHVLRRVFQGVASGNYSLVALFEN
jgi:hypothetical protein